MFAMFDIACPGLFIGQAIGRFGNFVNAEVYGGETSSLFGMSINGAPPVHPLFLYEAVWNVIGLVILLLIRDKKKADGQVFCFYLMWYSIGRFFLEGMRKPAYLLYVLPGQLGISQLVAVVLVIVAGIGAVVLQKRAKKAAAAEATEES
ncbi:MAG: prolipoprotein diacylglyceryl transferase [Clostridia bacterium]|nr:prolipoprotein diacylglyceryl transferase [Clostridia bacterium]